MNVNWSRFAVPVLALGAMGSFGALLASESLVQSWNHQPVGEDAFYQIARADHFGESVAAWGGPVATFNQAAGRPLRSALVTVAEADRARFVLPLDGWWGLTDRFGEPRGEDRFHTGLDIGLAGWEGSPVYSACDGVAVVATLHESYGNYVIVDCGDGWSTVSAHFSAISVEPGQQVVAGQTILGISGSTGFSTGEHLHFEVRYDGVPIDPESVLAFE